MKLLVTDNLVSDLNQLDKFDINLEKISIKEVPNQAQSLFENDKYKFVFDEFVTLTSFKKLNINLEDNLFFKLRNQIYLNLLQIKSNIDVLILK
jgi:hypothetical protein